MTKKDYELIAHSIISTAFTRDDPNDPERTLAENMDYDTVREIVEGLTEDLRQDNPRFDEAKFLTACGIKD